MELPQPNDSNFTPPPAGSHAAICFRFIDLGTQMVEWKGTRKTQRKVLLSWELPEERMETGEPFMIGRKYTWSMSDKAALRAHLQSWRGKAFTDDDFAGPNRFNIKNVLGKACLINIVHEAKDGGGVYANIAGISPMPKGMPVPQGVNPIVYFSLERHLFDATVLDKLSDKLKETIKGSPEYHELMTPARQNGGEAPPANPSDYGAFDDEVPF